MATRRTSPPPVVDEIIISPDGEEVIFTPTPTPPAADAVTIDEITELDPEDRPVDGVFVESDQGQTNGGRLIVGGKFKPVTVWHPQRMSLTIKLRNKAKPIRFINGQYTCRSEEELLACKRACKDQLYFADLPDGQEPYETPVGHFRTLSSKAFRAACILEVQAA